MESAQPRVQRRFRYTAPMHVRQRFVHAHLSKELATKLGVKKRSMEIRKGDTVKVMAGKQRGKSGRVNEVDLKRSFVFVEGFAKKTAKGKEVLIPIRASNVYITDLDLSDKYRSKKLDMFRLKKEEVKK